ncbi:hypothetical protein RJ640_015125 [Escallonia rubra]|uniref:DUF8040 domain-containing protein n=1 Tax=Escallonia rubra TaxID=112253 RepID=A0AA88R776_9ASTE|nr:hypothetical protein RJ640_015125 [Escallonia rubra]
MHQINFNENTRDIIRMGPDAFGRLVRILRGTGRLTDNAYSYVEEQVAKSLYILEHNERNRSIGFFFQSISFSSNPIELKSLQKFGITVDSFLILRVYVKVWVYRTISRNTIPFEGILAASPGNAKRDI